jgi:pantoate kinase
LKVLIPLHVSGIWIPRLDEDPSRSGSVGAGLNVTIYANAKAVPGGCDLLVNNNVVFKESSKRICIEAGVDVTTRLEAPFNLGEGFGLSAAALISHALLAFARAKRPLTRALQLAHELEVMQRTGLGDVIAEYTGGFVVRTVPGAPGYGYAYRVIPRTRVDLVVASTGFYESTSTMLSRMDSYTLELGERLLRDIVESEDLLVFFEAASTFTRRLFDYMRVDGALRRARGVVGYYLKKAALVVWVEREYRGEVYEALSKMGFKVCYASISQLGVMLVHTAKSP